MPKKCCTVGDLYKILWTSNRHAGTLLLQQIESVFNPSGENKALHYNTIIPMLRAIAPADELESMLAVQMVGTHCMAMSMMRRTMITDQTALGVNDGINRVAKLTRIFTTQLSSLNKHRGKGQQKMTVEHVHVNKGGQAVIGNVEGEGNEKKR